VGLEGLTLECILPSKQEAGKHRLWFHKQYKFQERANVRLVDRISLTQSCLGIFPSGLDPCRLWRHLGAGWTSFTLAILGLVRGSPSILLGKAPSESIEGRQYL
jgi:hypothetical protein